MKREALPPQERAKYDKAFDAACFLDDGNPVKAPDLGSRLLAGLRAVETDEPWPQYVIEDATIIGLQSKGKAWQNRREVHRTKRGDRVVTRSNVARIRSVTAETGETYYQAKFWEDMERAEVEAVVQEANIRIATDRVRVRDGLRLLDLMDATGTNAVKDALKQRNTSLSDYLTA